MIITRTPFRISFFGGGTDYPAWYQEHGGAVISTTINKYCYISCRFLPPFFDYRYRVRYTQREEVSDLEQIKHPAVRECLRYMKMDFSTEMVHTSDLPARSGIGSSSAFTVGFLHALFAMTGRVVTKRHLAREAIRVEQEIIKEDVGSQDQVAASFGGLNKIEFNGKEDFIVQPITIGQKKINKIQDHLMFFFTRFSRTASEIAKEQIKNTPKKKTELKDIKQMVYSAVDILNSNENGMTDFGKLLHEAWKLKRTLSSKISTDEIDQMYQTALDAGALGGKLCGAGGGGFMVLFVEPDKQHHVRKALQKLLYVPFRFETLGSQITLYSEEDIY
jgi:D-glycero-alpha-D-manno-heptose-7-phosphate kinase